MNRGVKKYFIFCIILQSVLCGAPKKRKYKATTALLGDRIISLCDDILKLTLDLPHGEGGTLMDNSETLNSCIRQFVKLLYDDDYFDKDVEKLLAVGPQPKFLEVELDDKRVQSAKENFGWNDKDIQDWRFVRLSTYQHWNHILTYKNHC